MEYQGQHGHATSRVDEYGNPVAAHGAGAGAGGQFQPAREEHKTGGILRRSGSSSSSSSSEDDGMGGRRKKGVKEKIKEKLPGGHKDGQKQTTATGGAYGQQGHAGMTGAGAHGTAATGEKKGIMDKIKEKLPGQQTTATGGAYGQHGHTGMTGAGAHGTAATGEKKGIMDKIKEKLPGQH